MTAVTLSKLLAPLKAMAYPLLKSRRPAAAVKVANIDSSLFVELETVD
jgi:hypothetical protein